MDRGGRFIIWFLLFAIILVLGVLGLVTYPLIVDSGNDEGGIIGVGKEIGVGQEVVDDSGDAGVDDESDGDEGDDSDSSDGTGDDGGGNATTQTLTACNDGLDNDGDGLVDWGYTDANDGFCSSVFDNSEGDVLQEFISWGDFPDFNLHGDLIMIYGGLWLDDCFVNDGSFGACSESVGAVPLNRGFSHIAGDLGLTQQDQDSIPVSKRASWWFPLRSTSINDISDEPWTDSIPWNNDISGVFHDLWDGEMEVIADRYSDSSGAGVPDVDIIVSDIESHSITDSKILEKKGDPRIPAEINALSDEEFIDEYKIEMSWLYDHTNSYPQGTSGFGGRKGSYNDAPIITGITGGIGSHQWSEWITDISLISYLFYDFTQEGEGFYDNLGPFMDTLEVIAPSGYYTSNYPNTFEENPGKWSNAGRYLARNLFLLDVNREWSGNRPVIEFQWMRFHKSTATNPYGGLRPWMAHNTAIFIFFSENGGSWLWDWSGYHKSNGYGPGDSFPISDGMQSANRMAYDNFIYGLYRLSQYNYMFNGNPVFYHPENSRDIYKHKIPVWRGVVNNGEMLVAAHNPYVAPHDTTDFDIVYNGQSLGVVTTQGLNTWLGVCDLGGGGCVGDEGD